MGCLKCCLSWFVLSGVGLAVLIAYLALPPEPLSIPEDGYWGPEKIAEGAEFPKDNENIVQFAFEFHDEMVANLREELARTKWFEPLEDSAYHYGVNLRTFKNFIEYWRTQFDFRSAQERLNAFPHYKTEIEGIMIHFCRSAAERGSNVRVIPLLMIHGWPGSFVEFFRVAPMLSKAVDGVAFDIIIPSLPGFGPSEPARKQGMDVASTARIFRKLMTRLGYSKYYIQGGDWGSAIATATAVLYPDTLRGIHLNTVFTDFSSPMSVARQTLFTWFPHYFGDGPLPSCLMLPFGKRFVDLLRESGYMHIQSTKPDTIGFALLNSPAGLAAYISEKFSTWAQDGRRHLDDGCHGMPWMLSMDDILLNIMVYYTSGCIISSQRYNRENFVTGVTTPMLRNPVRVPTGFIVFSNDIFCVPKFVASNTYKNITTWTYEDNGGHFAAYEQPFLFEEDVRLFVNEVERLYPEEVRTPTEFVVASVQ